MRMKPITEAEKPAAIKRLKEIAEELFNTANAFAGEPYGIAAVEMHQATNRLNKSIGFLENGITIEDRKEQLREWFKSQPYNKNKSPEDIEYMVNMLASKA